MTGKKETKVQRDDLQAKGRMQKLWAVLKPNGKVVLPRAPWVLRKVKEKQVEKTISEFQTPTGCMRSLKTAFTRDDNLGG